MQNMPARLVSRSTKAWKQLHFATKVKLLALPIATFCLVIIAIGTGPNGYLLHSTIHNHHITFDQTEGWK